MTPNLSSILRFADATLPSLASHLWSSTLFLIIVLLVLAAMPDRLTAGARFSLALIGIAKFAIPGAALVAGIRSLAGSRLETPEVLDLPLRLVGGALQFTAAPSTPQVWPAIVLTIWLSVAFVLIFRFALTRHRLVSLSVQTALPPLPREVAALSRAKKRVGVRRSIDLVRSALPEAPAVLRTFRPLLVLPAGGCDDLSDEELESLLSHECAHVARQDNLIARFESLICALFWFHPLIWLAQRITMLERERACDEVVAVSADERDTYVAALTKFCHAAIAPRLPGVSCMATAKLKERMDHVMNFSVLKAQSPSPKLISLLGAIGLVLFTLASGIIGPDRAFASGMKKDAAPYMVGITATRNGASIELLAGVTEKESQKLIAAPKLTLASGGQALATTSSGGINVIIDARHEGDDRVVVKVTIEKENVQIQQNVLAMIPDASGEIGVATDNFVGDSISMELNDAELRNVIETFGQLTGLQTQIDKSVRGKVTVSWQNVPWDKAFDSLMKDNNLTYRIEGSTIHVSSK